MPFPDDETIMKTATDLLAAFRGVFGTHPGFRPAHAKGIIVTGTFNPTPAAARLSIAPHFTKQSTPVIIRFSNSTGIPQIPDADPNASPRGIGIRFVLDESGHKHTDLIGHSTPHFPVRTGEEFLEFLQAIIAGPNPEGVEGPTAVEKFVGSHPATLAFVQAEKPTPTSLAKEAYFGLSALRLVDKNGHGTFVRFIVFPVLGKESADSATLKARDPDFLHEELAERLKQGTFEFKLSVQVAQDGDITDDITVHWPETREVVELGTIKVEKLLDNDKAEQKKIIYDPIPRVEGIEPSSDPLLEVRAALYLLSGQQRRAATQVE